MQITNNELEQPNIDTEIPNEIQATPFPKNSWLYPTNPNGFLERGVVVDSVTYYYDIIPDSVGLQEFKLNKNSL